MAKHTYINIQKQLGPFQLNVELDTAANKLALLGPSGCGKSVTLKCIAGILTPDKGQIILNGQTLFDSEAHINLPPQARRIGYLFQNYALFPTKTVAANLHMAGRGCEAAHVTHVVKLLGLEGVLGQKVKTLSGGQQQRVALGRILVNRPKTLLLDEPFSALDGYVKGQIMEGIQGLIEDQFDMQILVTHNFEEVKYFSEVVSVMDQGRTSPVRSVEAFCGAPQSTLEAQMVGYINISDVISKGTGLYATGWQVNLGAAAFNGDAGKVGFNGRVYTEGEIAFHGHVAREMETAKGFESVFVLENGVKLYVVADVPLTGREVIYIYRRQCYFWEEHA
ncbi:ATP-binding cassette domain-containing protein [Peptoniphilus equinus]|uniref:ATP-binding cassette domain-containing protein n=1 Tax=Peptoniphilus equinus TaxID=3016343 RepID=A0ABY7QUE9_9FIRM|nr:ATP-binding cassette domain-containing protein [Peptoniphilus equinus]WBW50066.1 ATP-binding cassette domain-containing protein [Peptoniphilus equinus]